MQLITFELQSFTRALFSSESNFVIVKLQEFRSHLILKAGKPNLVYTRQWCNAFGHITCSAFLQCQLRIIRPSIFPYKFEKHQLTDHLQTGGQSIQNYDDG